MPGASPLDVWSCSKTNKASYVARFMYSYAIIITHSDVHLCTRFRGGTLLFVGCYSFVLLSGSPLPWAVALGLVCYLTYFCLLLPCGRWGLI